MKKIVFLIAIAAIGATSCQNDAHKKEQEQKALMDSVATATKNIEQKKVSLQKQITDLQTQSSQFNEQLKDKESDLVAANDKLRSVSEFHLFRTSEEREADIKAQTRVVLDLQDDIKTLKQKMGDMESQQGQLQTELSSLSTQ